MESLLTAYPLTGTVEQQRFIFYARKCIAQFYGMRAERIIDKVEVIQVLETKIKFYLKVVTDIKNKSFAFADSELKKKDMYEVPPVPIRDFLLRPFYLNLEGQIYPEVMTAMEDLNGGGYVEAVLTGAIGTAKTTIAVWTMAYQLYLLSCMENPQKTFGLERASEILLIFQSITKELAKGVDYARFKALLENSPYFQRHFAYDKNIESELRFPNRIIVKPVSGSDTAAIGQNVMGGIIDELNYMAVVENSKASVDGGEYDQAIAVYNSIARRRKSRFMQQGALPGILCLVSSKRYPGQFTDLKQEEAKNDPTIYVYDKRVWDIKPDAFSNVWFQVFAGDESRHPRIIEEDEIVDVSDRDLIIDIPEEYRMEFDQDIINALREIAGMSTLARHPFIMNTDSIAACMTNDRPIVNKHWVDFRFEKLGIYQGRFADLNRPRWAHVDLGLTADSAGICIGYVKGFKKVDRGDHYEVLPEIVVDALLEVRPPKGGEIQFHKIRSLFYKLISMGYPLKWVSYDSYQSTDSMQMLRSKGLVSGHVSMDITRDPYEITKTALYDHRLSIPFHAKLRKELASLEDDPKTGDIDHPPNGSKDVADALAGVVSGLTTRREIWVQHKIPTGQIPTWLTTPKKDNMKAAHAKDIGDDISEVM